jgi:hypothetical protein
MDERRAECSCGRLSATARGEPLRISVCHCLACQRRTGSAFGVQARFPRDAVRTEGESRTYARTGDSGGTATFHFCPTCGASVYYELDGIPDALVIPVGAFADPTFPPPRVSVYEERQHGWLTLTGDIEHLA